MARGVEHEEIMVYHWTREWVGAMHLMSLETVAG